MIVDEGDHRLNRRSSSACAKYADALRRISLAWRSSRISRSSAFSRSAHRRWSTPGAPARCRARPAAPSHAASPPCSRSWPRSTPSPPTARGDPPSCSNTIRTARSRTSAENLFVVLLVMAPSSQELEPPANPGRFTMPGCAMELTLKAIHERGAKAVVVVATYPTILPLAGTCERLVFSAADAAMMRQVGDQLASTTRSAAEQGGAVTVDMNALGVAHSVCSTSPWTRGWTRQRRSSALSSDVTWCGGDRQGHLGRDRRRAAVTQSCEAPLRRGEPPGRRPGGLAAGAPLRLRSAPPGGALFGDASPGAGSSVVEPSTFNRVVVGSTPTRPTILSLVSLQRGIYLAGGP